jgi:hypothetical protein
MSTSVEYRFVGFLPPDRLNIGVSVHRCLFPTDTSRCFVRFKRRVCVFLFRERKCLGKSMMYRKTVISEIHEPIPSLAPSTPPLTFLVCYETIKRELNRRLIYECRCDERLKAKAEGSTRLTYTGLRGGLKRLKIETSLKDERYESVMGECVILTPQVRRRY